MVANAAPRLPQAPSRMHRTAPTPARSWTSGITPSRRGARASADGWATWSPSPPRHACRPVRGCGGAGRRSSPCPSTPHPATVPALPSPNRWPPCWTAATRWTMPPGRWPAGSRRCIRNGMGRGCRPGPLRGAAGRCRTSLETCRSARAGPCRVVRAAAASRAATPARHHSAGSASTAEGTLWRRTKPRSRLSFHHHTHRPSNDQLPQAAMAQGSPQDTRLQAWPGGR